MNLSMFLMLLNRFNYYLYMLYTCKAHLKICDSRLRGNKLINVKMLNVKVFIMLLLQSSLMPSFTVFIEFNLKVNCVKRQ